MTDEVKSTLRSWETGLFSCFSNPGICLQTYCCRCCTAANIANRLHENNPNCDCGSCCVMCCSCFMCGQIHQGWRREVIQRYKIQTENGCMSCVLATFCGLCTYCQVQNEMAIRGEHCGGCCSSAGGAPPAAPVMGADADVNKVAPAPFGADGRPAPKEWSTGLCSCGALECLEAYFCGCFVEGHIAGKHENLLNGNPENKFDCCSCFCSGNGFNYMHRREAVARYGVTESHCGSCLRTCCCPFCAQMQTRREMGVALEWPGGCCLKEPPTSVLEVIALRGGAGPGAFSEPVKTV